MGNCVMRGGGGGGGDVDGSVEEMVKVVTSNGGMMELYAPITAESITNEFPGHAIFVRMGDDDDDDREQEKEMMKELIINFKLSPPLLPTQQLHPGRLYYLLPLQYTAVRRSSRPNRTPYRMSLDNHGRSGHHQYHLPSVLPRYNSGGVWKVRLVINPDQLSEILSHESRTEALIQSLRTVAKCGATTCTAAPNTTTTASSSSSSSSSSSINY